jgi:hypothetical protein
MAEGRPVRNSQFMMATRDVQSFSQVEKKINLFYLTPRRKFENKKFSLLYLTQQYSNVFVLH